MKIFTIGYSMMKTYQRDENIPKGMGDVIKKISQG